jgi:nicotinate-nucleotide adenylyltransferase
MVEDRYPFRGTVHRSPGLTSLSPIGVLGGTFDPIHFAHLRLAEELADGIGLSKVRFIPTGAPPHRGTPRVSGVHRIEMVRLAIAGNPRFEADDREVRRTGVCYTFDTLNELRAELGERPLCLLMGSDAFSALTTWHRWEELFDLAHIVIAHRPGFSLQQLQSSLPGPLRKIYLQRLAASTGILRRDSRGAIYASEITALDIAATQIRGLLAGSASARYLVPDAVLDYIETHRLYKERDAR